MSASKQMSGKYRKVSLFGNMETSCTSFESPQSEMSSWNTETWKTLKPFDG